jgi:glycosyltransferase involved in cell wall biosynthesis
MGEPAADGGQSAATPGRARRWLDWLLPRTRPARGPRVVALLAAYNEERFLANCLDSLRRQGADFYLIDNSSTDGTVAVAERYRGRGLLGIEVFPRDGVFRFEAILRRKEELAATLPGDWFLHADADEIRLPPRGYPTLARAFAEAEARGYNAVNFHEFTFTPTREAPDHDHPEYLRTMRWYYPFRPCALHRVNAWKRPAGPLDLVTSGGHRVGFAGLRLFPEPFRMKHYLFLSAAHARRKYCDKVFDPESVARGWHGRRASLRPEEIVLPGRDELRPYLADDRLDASGPRAEHFLFAPPGPGLALPPTAGLL